MITQAELKRVLHYEPKTGIFTWLINIGSGGKPGKVAGCKMSIGYIQIGIYTKRYRAHRLAFLYMLGYMPEEVDHEDHIRHNNKWKNLRAASSKINKQNQPKMSTNTSGIMGVTWNTATDKWRAQIMVDRKNIYLGTFQNKYKAIAVRKAAEVMYGFHPNHGS